MINGPVKGLTQKINCLCEQTWNEIISNKIIDIFTLCRYIDPSKPLSSQLLKVWYKVNKEYTNITHQIYDGKVNFFPIVKGEFNG